MEMKGSQTHTAGFGFDADKLREAEQSTERKPKTRLKTRKRKPFSFQPEDVGGRLAGVLERAVFVSRASRKRVWEPWAVSLVTQKPWLQAGVQSTGTTKGTPDQRRKSNYGR